MKKKIYVLYKTFAIVALCFSIYSFTFEHFIYPRLGIYFSQDANRIKIGCAKGFIVSGKISTKHTFIDGKKYNLGFIYLHNKEKIPLYQKRHIFENDLKSNPQNKCHKVKYISVIDLGFWKKFYLYDYIQD